MDTEGIGQSLRAFGDPLLNRLYVIKPRLLKVKEEASRRIKSVYITKPEAYDIMWQKLESYYEGVGASVQAALDDLHVLKPIASGDFKSLVELVDEVESAYSLLSELGKKQFRVWLRINLRQDSRKHLIMLENKVQSANFLHMERTT